MTHPAWIRKWLLCLLAPSAVACAGAAPEPRTARSEPAAPEQRPTPTSAETPAPEDGSLPAADPASKDPALGAAGFELHAWAYDRQLTVDLVADACRPAELGEKPGDVIWCDHHKELKQGVVLHSRALYAARAKRLVKLVEIPVAVSTIDVPDEPSKRAQPFRIALELTRSSDGKQVEVREADGSSCEQAHADNDENAAVAAAIHRELKSAITRVCRERGTWSWRGGTLVRLH